MLGPLHVKITMWAPVQVYKAMAKPVEDFYRQQGTLLDFEITGGIPETLPRLLSTLQPYVQVEGKQAEHSTA